MVVILIVRHCEEKSVAVLVVIPMCDGFDQKSVTLTLLMATLLCGPFDQNSAMHVVIDLF